MCVWVKRLANLLYDGPSCRRSILINSRFLFFALAVNLTVHPLVMGWSTSSLLARESPVSRINREQLLKSIEKSRSQFASQMQELADFCSQNSLELEAGELRKLAMPLESNVLQGENLPRQIQEKIADDLPKLEREWRIRKLRIQQEFSEQLFLKAKTAIDAGMISQGFELIREVARQNPDHPRARALLGYVRTGDFWVTPHAKKMLDKNCVWTDQWGWLPRDHVKRYENGERYYQREWMTAQKESSLRQDFRRCWEVETDHFKIRTNHSQEMGVELGKHLEDFYRIFFQTFAGFISSKEQLNKIIQGKSTASSRGKRAVHFYRTKKEYVERLQSKFSQSIEGTTGLYISNDAIAHFFHNTDATPDERLATMFHEATHQLFSEEYAVNKAIGVNGNFWVIEAIACYMESFQRLPDDSFSLGDPRYIRFQNAQVRLLRDDYYVPLQQLASLGYQDFQADPNIMKNYSQGAGMAHFFMHYQDGLYRDEFINHLKQIYSVNDRIRNNPASLEELTAVEFGELDRQYRNYISTLVTSDPAVQKPR